MSGEGWVPFDYEDRDANPLPAEGDAVWVFDEFYDGVTIGYWVGYTWQTIRRGDDVSVTHWAPMSPPPPPGDDDAQV